jgi:hypothetical protein
MGAIYAAHQGFDSGVKIFILEEHSTLEYRDFASESTALQLIVTGHTYAAVAIWAVVIMFIRMRWAGMEEWRPGIYQICLILTLIGSIITFIGSASVPLIRPIAHQIIFRG